MRRSSFFSALFSLAVLILVFGTSCSSSRFYKDFQYSPREKAPDVGSQVLSTEKDAPAIQQNSAKSQSEAAIIPVEHPQIVSNGEVENAHKIDQVVQAFKEEMVAREDKTDQVSNREMMKKVSNKLTEEGQISPLTRQQEKKLDRMAAKMDKKLKKEGNDIDWRHNTPLELFFMIMGIAGLVLGIASVSWGWFVFIVFGGIWLYFKLVQNKK
jgi:hypothetical protein